MTRAADITNPKVGSTAPPTWQPYSGLSILYDDPGCAALSGLQRFEALSGEAPWDDRLYRELEAVTGELEAGLREEVALCALPRRTYHVTLCDVVNDGTREQVPADLRSEVAATLAALPDSLLWCSTLMRLVQDPELSWSVWRQPVMFRVDALEVRGHALVASLEPADEPSVAAVAAHDAAREALLERLASRLGVASRDWRPHLTLGYFANDHDAAYARTEVVPGWQAPVSERTAGLSATFRSAAVYGFTDMVSFWRVSR